MRYPDALKWLFTGVNASIFIINRCIQLGYPNTRKQRKSGLETNPKAVDHKKVKGSQTVKSRLQAGQRMYQR